MERIDTLKSLRPGEFALMKVDPETGVALNAENRWCLGGEEFYLAFSDEPSAREFAQGELSSGRAAEWLLYDSTGEFVSVFRR